MSNYFDFVFSKGIKLSWIKIVNCREGKEKSGIKTVQLIINKK